MTHHSTQPAAKPFAEQVHALAKAAGFEDQALVWALTFSSIEGVQARIEEAVKIRGICALARKPDAAAGFIQAGRRATEVGAEILNAQAAAADDTYIDTATSYQAGSRGITLARGVQSLVSRADMVRFYGEDAIRQMEERK